MEKEFIPYEQALALKELGFDEPCFCRYCIKTIFEEPTGEILLQNKDCKIYQNRFLTKVPLYQQAFRWFREKYNLHQVILADHKFKYDIIVGERIAGSCLGQYNTYEEAELECLKRLIEIVKNK